jgi:alanine dehydrogenase
MGTHDVIRDFLVLSRQDIAGLLTFSDYVDAVDRAFRLHAEGKAIQPDLLHLDAAEGEFHIKAGGFAGERGRVAVKVNGGFFNNPARHGMPAIQGVIVLSDAETGRPLACLESGEITVKRTGALTAIAVAHLARPAVEAATIIGCGRQARTQWLGLCHARAIPRLFLVDRNPEAADLFASELAGQAEVSVVPFENLGAATRNSDVIVTCTPARRAFLGPDHLMPGALVVAVGADSPDKQELDPRLLTRGRIVVDILSQCAEVGELHHGLAEGLLERHDVYAELGDILVGRKPGRVDANQTFIFDTTGTALQDAAAANVAYDRALATRVGVRVRLVS